MSGWNNHQGECLSHQLYDTILDSLPRKHKKVKLPSAETPRLNMTWMTENLYRRILLIILKSQKTLHLCFWIDECKSPPKSLLSNFISKLPQMP